MLGPIDAPWPVSNLSSALDLVRLSISRRAYTQCHIDYVIEVCQQVAEKSDDLRGYRIASEPAQLRHFTARFEPLPG